MLATPHDPTLSASPFASPAALQPYGWTGPLSVTRLLPARTPRPPECCGWCGPCTCTAECSRRTACRRQYRRDSACTLAARAPRRAAGCSADAALAAGQKEAKLRGPDVWQALRRASARGAGGRRPCIERGSPASRRGAGPDTGVVRRDEQLARLTRQEGQAGDLLATGVLPPLVLHVCV